jgi:hypothetical protein
MSKKPASEPADLESPNIPAQLWTIMTKLYGVGELIRSSRGEAALNQDEVNYGIGEIITDLADELREIRDVIEAQGPDWSPADGPNDEDQ